MVGPILPAVRLPSLPVVPMEDVDGPSQEPVVAELSTSSKFGFAWPTPSSSDQLLASEAETDSSEVDLFAAPKDGLEEESEHITPTNTNPMDRFSPPLPSRLPLSRAFSMPSPSQLRHLSNPRRLAPSPEGECNAKPVELSTEFSHFHELSLELADSVQTAIQMLLQISPPQIFDHAKEQLSGCSVAIPTPSLSAMLTCMKHLNYISANMSVFSSEPSNSCSDPIGIRPGSLSSSKILSVETHFDIGEMLQSVADSLSGLAVQAGVDLIIVHQNAGMKHVAVHGDESGLSYSLSYIIRQIIGTAWGGDSVEVSMFLESTGGEATSIEEPAADSTETSSASKLRCTFYIAHRFSASESSYRPSSTPPSPTGPSAVPSPDSAATSSRPVPSFQTIIMRCLLRQINADFVTDLPPVAFSAGRASELVLTLDHGRVSENQSLTNDSDEIDTQVAQEPTLRDLAQFSETLQGKKVTLCASSRSSFAHHLSSYLTAWGLDVSHVSIDAENIANGGVEGTPAPEPYASFSSSGLSTPAPIATGENLQPPSFLLIDDCVNALKKRLEQLRLQRVPLNSKRRSTFSHRPKSSPHVPEGMGFTQDTVVIHFASLGNLKMARETINQIISSTSSSGPQLPEVIVIPKPAGPRRLLTALFTASKKPIIDPFFSPIATSITSSSRSSFFSLKDGSNSRHTSRPSGGRTNSDRSAKSPKDIIADTNHLPSSPLAVSDGMEYFSEATKKLGSSPSSGLVIQSPDGQPAGIYFQPGAKSTGLGLGITSGNEFMSPAGQSPSMERDRGQFGVPRRGSESLQNINGYLSGTDPIRRSPRAPLSTNISEASVFTDRRDEVPTSVTSQQDLASSVQRRLNQSLEGMAPKALSPPGSPEVRSPARRGINGRRIGDSKPSTPLLPQKKSKAAQEGNIVPPISVLIVDDNPINQTILSTFMKQKKIKYDVAKNGEEAVQKWKSGIFHLILMDIQMPVMNGIQATKEIRRMEKLNGAVGFPTTPAGTPSSDGQTTPSDGSGASNESRLASTPYRSSVIIVALTASSLQSDRVAALAAGCNDFLTKPVSLHWLNSKIIEWGSIKALQMWADIRPDMVKNFSSGQAAQAQNVARRLHVPEGRTTPTKSRSGSSSPTRQVLSVSKLASDTKPSLSTDLEVPPSETDVTFSQLVTCAAVSSATGSSADVIVFPDEDKVRDATSPKDGGAREPDAEET